MTTSITISFGFTILLLSNFIPTIYFGIFTSIAMIVAMLGILTTLPKLLIIFNIKKIIMNLDMLSLFDYFILIIICISILISFFKGFIQSFLGLLTWIGAVILTLIFYENLAFFITNYFK